MGTLIRTPQGERRVEDLAAGDAVVTHDGATEIVRWIGTRHLRLAAQPNPARVMPVRIGAGAFGPNLPVRDLVLSPGHGVFVAGVLIPAGALVNGQTVTPVDWSEVDYVHVELDRHDILVAEGLAVESYLDVGNRNDFENADGPVNLHPTFAAMAHEAACAPFVVAGPVLDAVRARLAERAQAMLRDRRRAG